MKNAVFDHIPLGYLLSSRFHYAVATSSAQIVQSDSNAVKGGYRTLYNDRRRKKLNLCLALFFGGCLFGLSTANAETFDIESDGFFEPNIEEEFEFRSEEIMEPQLDADVPVPHDRTSGPRILVKKIRFDRLPEFPKHGITVETVTDLVEDKRRRLMLEDIELGSGFTRAELEEIASYLRTINADPNHLDDIDPAELKDLYTLMKRQRSIRGITYGDIEVIAAEVTQFYRSKGFFLAKAYVPAQEVEDGIVTISVYEGALGKVSISDDREDKARYSGKRLRLPFKNSIGKAVRSADIEKDFYLLNDYPGLNAYGFFSAGENLGETDLMVNVRAEKRWAMFFRMDNHGSRFSGDRRFYTYYERFNASGYGDRLSLGYLKSTRFDSDINLGDSDIGLFSYKFPIYRATTELDIKTEFNKFTVDSGDGFANALGLGGEHRSHSIHLNHKLFRSRKRNLSIGLAISDKETELQSTIAQFSFDVGHTQGITLKMDYDFLSEVWQALNVLNFKIHYGDFIGELSEGKDSYFYRFSLDTNSLMFLPLPFTNRDSRILLTTKWNYSESVMPGYEQATMGGAHGVRAFTSSDFSGDRVAMMSLGWYLPIPESFNFNMGGVALIDALQFALIYDDGYGEQNSAKESKDPRVHLSGAGMLFKFAWSTWFSAELSFMQPTSVTIRNNTSTKLDIEERSVRTYLDMTFSFK